MSERFVLNKPVLIGDRSGFTFTVGGVLTDPTTITLVVTAPDGTATTYTWPSPSTITKLSTGTFQKQVTGNQVGTWSYVITSTGTAADVQDGTFDIYDDVPITTRYATLDQLKNQKGIPDTADDTVLEIALSAASRQIDGYCGQRFWQDSTPTALTFFPTSPRYLDLMEDDNGDSISTTTGLVVKVDMDQTGTYESVLTINTDFIVLPTNAAARIPVYPYTAIQIINTTGTTWFPRSLYGNPTVQVTAKWGWPAVPDDIRLACLIQAQMLASAKDAAFGVAALASIDGAGMRALPWNPLARSLVDNYQKPAVG